MPKSSVKKTYPPVDYLPLDLCYAARFRNDVVVFSSSAKQDVVSTNLPVDAVPDELLNLCSNIAEKALLAYVAATGGSMQYAHLDYCIEKMRNLAREFACEFLQPLSKPGTTQVIAITELSDWYAWHGCYGWGRSIRNPPGTEYA